MKFLRYVPHMMNAILIVLCTIAIIETRRYDKWWMLLIVVLLFVLKWLIDFKFFKE